MQVRDTDAGAAYEKMKGFLAGIEPDYETRYKADLVAEINRLKAERNAIILGHNYMEAALYHTVTDFQGDSLDLARRSAESEADIIVFCGVEFMAETAKILNPKATVLVPSDKAGCSLAESITAQDVRDLRKRFPGVPVVTYVNSYADVKAESDACCTSGNAKEVAESFGTESIIFLPDEFLARNVAKETGMEIIFPSKKPVPGSDTTLNHVMIGWEGRCEVHEKFTPQDVINVRTQFPDVVVLAHPECSPEVVEQADFSGSTKRMIEYVQKVDAPRYLLLTECAMGDNIVAANPDKELLSMCNVRCPHMNQITLENTRDSLIHNKVEVHVEESVRLRAKKALDYMLQFG